MQFPEKICVPEYEKLHDDFAPESCHPDCITDLTADAAMKYVSITTGYHDSFSVWTSM